MAGPRYPALYQVNTRVWLTDIARNLGRPATLDDIPDAELDQLAACGFDWIWFLSVWQTGLRGQQISRTHPQWRHEFAETLPDLTDQDIPGSGFAISAYVTHAALGGDAALARLRERLRQRGLRLMLDFVPNHTALDHPWVEDHPEYYVAGSELDLERQPRNFTRVTRQAGDCVLAHGRDPYFDGWPDTLQLDYSQPATQAALLDELLRISAQCDGLRCDMAMLVLPEVFARTWNRPSEPFWPRATQAVRAAHPAFCFLAEVYWDLEWTLQQQGFDYAYDKRLYDRLRERSARPVREHLRAGLDYQDKLARFLENHDEPRAAATFPPAEHQAAAVISFLSPGLRFFHQGQFTGRKVRISPHLGRRPNEPVDESLARFYGQLLELLHHAVVRDGHWQALEPLPTWEGNGTHDCFVIGAWEGPGGERWLVPVNYADHASQCHVRLPFADLAGRTWRLRDRLRDESYDWQGGDLVGRGLYLDMPAWQASVYTLEPAPSPG